jgi:8-oxo-dGTP diphosphatase
VTVDIIILSRRTANFDVLLIRRKHDPFAGRWALPGGFVDENEPLEAAARRELEEETGVRDVPLTQLRAFGDPGRDPRGWTVSIAFYVVLDAATIKPKAADDAAEVGWFPLEKLPEMAFDHEEILAVVTQRVGTTALSR